MNAYDKLLEEARGRPFACIVGWPVEHSRSPALHGFWLKQHKVDGHYGRLPVEPNRAALQELVAFLRRTPNARGCNLTLPHKIEIMPLLDRIDPLAVHIGAVNTVSTADGDASKDATATAWASWRRCATTPPTGGQRAVRLSCWAPVALRGRSLRPWWMPAFPSFAWSIVPRVRRSTWASRLPQTTDGRSWSTAGSAARRRWTA
jgi:hypothetical protein